MKQQIPVGQGEAVFMEGRADNTKCDIHDWPNDGLPVRLIAAMRATHGKGGINACTDCIKRAERVSIMAIFHLVEVELHSLEPSAIEATRVAIEGLPGGRLERKRDRYFVPAGFVAYACKRQGYVKQVFEC